MTDLTNTKPIIESKTEKEEQQREREPELHKDANPSASPKPTPTPMTSESNADSAPVQEPDKKDNESASQQQQQRGKSHELADLYDQTPADTAGGAKSASADNDNDKPTLAPSHGYISLDELSGRKVTGVERAAADAQPDDASRAARKNDKRISAAKDAAKTQFSSLESS